MIHNDWQTLGVVGMSALVALSAACGDRSFAAPRMADDQQPAALERAPERISLRARFYLIVEFYAAPPGQLPFEGTLLLDWPRGMRATFRDRASVVVVTCAGEDGIITDADRRCYWAASCKDILAGAFGIPWGFRWFALFVSGRAPAPAVFEIVRHERLDADEHRFVVTADDGTYAIVTGNGRVQSVVGHDRSAIPDWKVEQRWRQSDYGNEQELDKSVLGRPDQRHPFGVVFWAEASIAAAVDGEFTVDAPADYATCGPWAPPESGSQHGRRILPMIAIVAVVALSLGGCCFAQQASTPVDAIAIRIATWF